MRDSLDIDKMTTKIIKRIDIDSYYDVEFLRRFFLKIIEINTQVNTIDDIKNPKILNIMKKSKIKKNKSIHNVKINMKLGN